MVSSSSILTNPPEGKRKRKEENEMPPSLRLVLWTNDDVSLSQHASKVQEPTIAMASKYVSRIRGFVVRYTFFFFFATTIRRIPALRRAPRRFDCFRSEN